MRLESFIDPKLAAHVEESRRTNAERGMRRGPSNPGELREFRTEAPDDNTLIEADGRQVPIRILHPTSAPRGVYLDFHGGGFYLGSAAQDDARNQRLADALGIVVVSVDYRLAPEHPWPAAPDDAETAAHWLLDNAGERFGTDRLAIGGFSAGSTLAVTTLLRLRDQGKAARFSGAVLQFGTYDVSGLTPAGRLIADEYFIEAYAGHVPDRTIPDLSPVFADLRGLPPFLMVVGDQDVILEDNLAMAARVVGAGGEVDLKVYPESRHGFTNRDNGMARAAWHDIEQWLGEHLNSAQG
ncbi:Acetyl esterase/lipase [Lentzea waywayandensis]|uniref:Acetyl esterase/lipase n=1 Tax=Lentzea waywayandensis TaxID=84724 RepID=A0A1I6DL91_9PSEU|nr:alpha/beta hydrolase [Lentzea waywayandensis]SFR06122.1 Acetyl esterase/lipase [Lentzea waywayandensis]